MIPDDIPSGWAICSIAEISEPVTAKVNPLAFPEEHFEYYSIPAFQSGETPELTRGFDIHSQKVLLPPRCVLFGKLNPRVEKVWNVKSEGPFRCIASTEWLPMVPHGDIEQDWLYFSMYSNWVMPVAQSLVAGSTPSRQRVDQKSFYDIPVPVPKLDEQRAIARILNLLAESTRFQMDQIRFLNDLKRVAMRTLFTRGLRGEAQKETEIGLVPESWKVTNLGIHS